MTYRLQFTEKMIGAFTLGETDYQAGYTKGLDGGDGLMFRLTIATDDAIATTDRDAPTEVIRTGERDAPTEGIRTSGHDAPTEVIRTTDADQTKPDTKK